MKTSALVIGGSGQIAQAIIDKLLTYLTAENIVVISRGQQSDKFANVISAKVASIKDNQLSGWYKL